MRVAEIETGSKADCLVELAVQIFVKHLLTQNWHLAYLLTMLNCFFIPLNISRTARLVLLNIVV